MRIVHLRKILLVALATAWSEAFDKLHGKFSREYAFTEWKAIDWPALYKKFKPLIDQAQASKDFPAYYLALRKYVHSGKVKKKWTQS